jgi:hypothetical protein
MRKVVEQRESHLQHSCEKKRKSKPHGDLQLCISWDCTEIKFKMGDLHTAQQVDAGEGSTALCSLPLVW